MDAEIRNRLLDINPWQEAPDSFLSEIEARMPAVLIERSIRLDGFDNTNRAKLIVGPRQAGKSTFVWSLLKKRNPKEILFLNGEESLVRKWTVSAGGMLRDLEEEFPSVRVLFIDEAQHIENTGLLVKGLIDGRRGFDILVTGSSSFHLLDRIRESLAGRAERRILLPFSIKEIVGRERDKAPAVKKRAAWQSAQKQMVWGGYPGVWFHSNPGHELKNLVESVVLRDASDLFRIHRPEAFRKLLQLAAGQVGQMVNYSEWASLLSISSNTVREYLNIMEETWVVHQLPAFSGGRRREITSASRIHFFDMGLRNAVIRAFDEDLASRPDRGALAEGLAFGELYKCKPSDWTLHYWRAKGGAEVDFVLSFADRLIAVEVKSGSKGKISRSARSFIDAYAPEAFVIASATPSTSTPPEKLKHTHIYRTGIDNLHELIEGLF